MRVLAWQHPVRPDVYSTVPQEKHAPVAVFIHVRWDRLGWDRDGVVRDGAGQDGMGWETGAYHVSEGAGVSKQGAGLGWTE